MDYRAHEYLFIRIDDSIGFFNNILLEEFVDYSLIFMRSRSSMKEVWGAHLGEHTARGTWSFPEASYTLNYLEPRRSLALKEFQDLWLNKMLRPLFI